MADQNMKVAYRCHWCGEPFHDVDLYWPDHPMHPKQIYVDKEGNQFDSIHCKKMFHGGWGFSESLGKVSKNKTP